LIRKHEKNKGHDDPKVAKGKQQNKQINLLHRKRKHETIKNYFFPFSKRLFSDAIFRARALARLSS